VQKAQWELILFLIFFTSSKIFAITNYVSLSGGHVSPFTSWADAATNIQTAVDVASDDDMVLVNDGTYYPIDTITVKSNITIKSNNGAENTIVDAGFPKRTNGCFILNNYDAKPTNDGFTITNGYSYEGGGVFCRGGTVQSCLINGNSAADNNGGAYCNEGMIFNCTIIGNSATANGGVRGYNGTVLNSILWNNTNGNFSSSGSSSTNFYNCIEDWTSLANGIITNSPEFIDAAFGNYNFDF